MEERAFVRQLRMAIELGKPSLVRIRSAVQGTAHSRALDILMEVRVNN